MKIFRSLTNNILLFVTLFLLAFIPLYPKLPLLDVEHTWVYVRIEDVLVMGTVLLWVVLLLRKKVTLKTPLTIPILLFWVIGGIATLHGVLLVFPTLTAVFSNVAFLSYLRRIEYIFLFFIAFSAIRDKKNIHYVVATLSIVLLFIVGYGFGQKFLGFPAFLTMNEEFAKGVPIQLSDLSRVPSTFAGHYDLAAYLVLLIPLLTSVAFGVKNIFAKVWLLGTALLGIALLSLTVSRVSFFVLILSLLLLLILQKKKWIVLSFVALAIGFLVFLSFSPSLLKRFGSTFSEVDVLVDAKTGVALGHVKDTPASYFDNKVVLREFYTGSDRRLASSAATLELPHEYIPAHVTLLVESNIPTGENLPQGTAYVNLPLSPVIKKINQYYFEKSQDVAGQPTEVRIISGDYLIKRAVAYDLSYTTRIQGEWPRTFDAFAHNIFLGSGYGSVSLAVDNNYLRILGESGLLGLASFLSIFLVALIYIKKILPRVDSPLTRSFAVGFVVGTFGLALNAVLIDVFEASKVAFTLWLLMGITLGTLHLYNDREIDFASLFRKVVISPYAVVVYLFICIAALLHASADSYFVGDDFTWFRWVADCSSGVLRNGSQQCLSLPATILQYFTEANGFFYRPGTKMYFSSMYSVFWLNQAVYHYVSISLHFFAATLVFFLSRKILKNYFLSVISAGLFLILSGAHEAIFWISSTGFLFNAVFALLSLLFFIYWKEKKNVIFFILSVFTITLSLLFHEMGVIVPLLVILYDMFDEKFVLSIVLKKSYYLILLSPLLPYFLLRIMAQSHWFNGDYSYNLLKLPYNIVGNIIGYLVLALFGPASMRLYEILRSYSRGHVPLAIIASLIVIVLIGFAYRLVIKKVSVEEKRIVIFASLFFVISLLPFLGLGNIASRYSYLSSFGFVLVFALVFEKVYGYLLTYGKNIAILSITIIAMVFFMLHLFQMQKAESDWNEAGLKSQRFLVSLNGTYDDSFASEHMQFYFVNVPIRNGNAWVFPVGLNDAVWFAFRNPNIGVSQVSTLDQAFSEANPLRDKVFEFESGGEIVEKEIPISTVVTPVRK